MSLYAALRPLLFRLSPDRSHALAQAALRWEAPWRMLGGLAGLRLDDPRLRTRYGGVELPGPVGLAAGFDKDASLVGALSCLGFGFLTIGSIMSEPRFGNPFPRLVRYPETESLADSMGLPSRGRDHAVACLSRAERRVPVFANVAGFSAAEIAATVLAVAPHVDAIEISLLCPNLERKAEFDEIALLRAVVAALPGCPRPLTVRVPNDTTANRARLAEFLGACLELGLAGAKIGGGRPVEEPRLGTGRGTLHGPVIFDAALANVAYAAQVTGGRLPIKGNGGVRSAADVRAMLDAGASCVDLYTAFIYRGWDVAARIHRDLLRMAEEGEPPPAPVPMPA